MSDSVIKTEHVLNRLEPKICKIKMTSGSIQINVEAIFIMYLCSVHIQNTNMISYSLEDGKHFLIVKITTRDVEAVSSTYLCMKIIFIYTNGMLFSHNLLSIDLIFINNHLIKIF